MQAEQVRVARAIAAVKAGDPSALHFLYVRYADDVRGYVKSVVRTPDDAEDLTQDVFLKLPRVLCRYEERGLPFERWLIRVARNCALDFLRARRQVPVAEVYPRTEGYEERSVETIGRLRDALATLPPDQREVVVLRHFAGLSPPEIAHRLSRSEASVHGLHHRGRRAMRRSLTDAGAQPVPAA
jgi:RNA polymerase sigma-70 factor (ECF subfamily)